MLEQHALRKEEIRIRLDDFSRVPEEEYFYEICYCLLTPQTNAFHADAVVKILKQQNFQENFFDTEELLRSNRHYIRFHRTKAKRLALLREQYPLVLESLRRRDLPPIPLREEMIRMVNGFGYKEATHFLRNIGKSGGLAILDRHILRYLKDFGVLRSFPETLSKLQYLKIERKFQKFALSIGISIEELDLLFWSMGTGSILK